MYKTAVIPTWFNNPLKLTVFLLSSHSLFHFQFNVLEYTAKTTK
uniref:Uncharacterized protein n=1 Tax=Anguilla anguilla TaxID=7936 RepID=A0A0E9VRG5_ANGAN